MTDYWKMYALLHSAVLEVLEKMDNTIPERRILERALRDVEKVYAQTHDQSEDS